MLLVVAALALAAVVGLAVEQQSGCPWFHGEARLPTVSASPQETVRAYLDAVVNNDRKTARHITSPDFLRQQGAYSDSPFCNWRKVSNLQTYTPAPARDGYREAATIHVEFGLERRAMITSGDIHTVWGYVLGRESPTDRWKLIDVISRI